MDLTMRLHDRKERRLVLSRDTVAEPCVEQCGNCAHRFLNFNIQKTCKWYLYPAAMWRGGKKCPGATHIKKKVPVSTSVEKKRVGQPKGTKKK